MAAVDDSVIAGKITTLFGNNTTKAISEADLREVANDLNDSKANKTYVDALVVGLWDDRGNFDASVNAYPSTGGSGTSGAILKGDIWTISVAGTLPTGLIVKVGDTVRALVNTPGNTQANWAINITYKVDKDSIASSAPTVSFDSSKGYGVYYTVLDTSTGLTYICRNASVGAAVWELDTSKIISFKVTANQAAIYAGSDINIPELPSLPVGYMWEYLSAMERLIGVTTPYDGSPAIELFIVGASKPQFFDAGAISAAGADQAGIGLTRRDASVSPSPTYAEWDGVALSGVGRGVLSFGSAPSTTGDGTLTVFGTARIIKL